MSSFSEAPFRPPQQAQDFGCLAALAGTGGGLGLFLAGGRDLPALPTVRYCHLGHQTDKFGPGPPIT
jgi:hypothetical protein